MAGIQNGMRFCFCSMDKHHIRTKFLDDNSFYLVGEVYNYKIDTGQYYDFGDRKVNYFDNSFHSLINFGLKVEAERHYEVFFSKYSKILQNDLKGYGTLNYLSSHDDGSPFDGSREKPYRTATTLLFITWNFPGVLWG